MDPPIKIHKSQQKQIKQTIRWYIIQVLYNYILLLYQKKKDSLAVDSNGHYTKNKHAIWSEKTTLDNANSMRFGAMMRAFGALMVNQSRADHGLIIMVIAGKCKSVVYLYFP